MLGSILLTLETKEQKSKFEKIYYDYHKYMMNIAFEITNDKFDTEEAVQTALFSIAEKIDKVNVDNPTMLKSYIYKIVKNTSLNIIKKKRKHLETVSLEQLYKNVSENTISDLIESEEGYLNLVKKVSSISEVYRDVLVLYYLHDLTVSDISYLLKRKKGTIKIQLQRGREILKKILKEENIE